MVRVLVAVVLVACSGAPGGPTMNNKIDDGTTLAPQRDPVESADILAREPIANTVKIKHILIGWNDGTDESRKDQRALKRTKKDAEDQIRTLVEQIKGGADFDELMKKFSEDPGSATSARAYDVSPEAQLVIEFKQLGLRLKIGEVGVVQSEYGFHIMKRVE
jgi:peptidyl-prolyl cis-trans isomerase D